jgi:DNA-binding beta-propeller fold protein YncE
MTSSSSYLACHHSYDQFGTLSIVEINNNQFKIHSFPQTKTQSLDAENNSIYLYFFNGRAYCLDGNNKQVTAYTSLSNKAIAGYAYMDSSHANLWFMNDGDDDTGVDHLNCGDEGSSVTVIHQKDSDPPHFLKTICVGKGHHVTAFVNYVDKSHTQAYKAFVSNLMDGSLSVIDNNPGSQSFLQVIDLINLADSRYENSGNKAIPNHAYPHGMVFSKLTGKLYSLNNGYETVAVIDPVSHKIIDVFPMPKCSNLLLSPDGRYLIGKGADRKTDAQHVIGHINVFDLKNMKSVAEMELLDIYPSTYQFNREGKKLYVTTAYTGDEIQSKNLKTDQLLVFKADFPDIKLEKSISVGQTRCKRRPFCICHDNNQSRFIFVPNMTDGTMSILDASTHETLVTPVVSTPGASDVTFSYWRNCFYGT